MSRPDWLRTFVAIYRAGSVTDGARLRALSQPAASQQLAGLEAALGHPLFVRTTEGVTPTERGRSLYGEVAPALDQLEAVLAGLDAGRVAANGAPLRVGCSAEFFSFEVTPKLVDIDVDVVARFGSDEELLRLLEHGEIDVAVTSSSPPRRALTAMPIGEKRFVLVAAAAQAPTQRFASLDDLGQWLADRPWVTYSLEFPITRRFWQSQLGRPFSAHLRLVAPDLRAVVGAVERGLGCSLLPSFVCSELLERRVIAEVHPVSELIPPEAWYLCLRQGELTRPAIAEFARVLSA